MRRLILLTAFALGACGGGGDKDQENKAAPPDVAANFAQPLDARGADPDWGLTIRGTTLTLSQAGQPDLVAVAPGAVIDAHTASWSAALPDGRTLKVSFYASRCEDRTTGATYPFAAEAQLPGAEALEGCGGPPAGARAGAKPPAAARR